MILEWYCKNFGISDLDIAEAPWIISWIDRNHNNLKYNHYLFKFIWIGCHRYE